MERESRKLETYTDLSSTLAKVSPSAAASVAPSLAAIVQNHALYKSQVEDDLNALTHIWEDVFQVFIRGVGNVLDMGLEDALRTLKKEKEKNSADMQNRDKDKKKKRGGDEDCDRDRKRRRMEMEDGQVAEKFRFPSRSDSHLGDMYDDMRAKLDRQAQRLNQLTTENHEVSPLYPCI
jgi:tRNA/tmRNA/rRNA uracil-C5-methylase (TrmA/RlmC/RlmD family)